MASDLFLAFVGALFGVALTAAPGIIRRLRGLKNRRAAEKRRALMKTDKVNAWLLDYYRRRGVNTFTCEIGGIKRAVPILTRAEWILTRPIDMNTDWPIEQRPAPRHELEVDMAAIKRQEQLGTNLYETIQDSLYLDMMQPDDQTILATRPCRYFALASSLIYLEDETFAGAARRSRRRRTPFRDEHLPAQPRPGEERRRPFSVGGLAVFAVRTGDSYEIAIQSRSSQVLTAPNAKAVLPNFGLTENLLTGNRSVLGVLQYNFIKEYLEEMYNYEELIGNVMERRVDPDWFLDFSEAKELLALTEQGMFTLTYLGAGVDCLSNTTVIAMLATIEDPTFAETIKRRLVANWEVAIPKSNSPAVQFVKTDDRHLSMWLEGGEYQASSAFALALALPELNRKLAKDPYEGAPPRSSA